MKFVSLLIALVVGFGGGWYVQSTQATTDSHDSHDDGSGHAMEHEPLEVADGQPVPTVDLTVHEDPMSGYNAQIVVENLRFAPESVSTEHVAGEGHAHIYVDGVKINRVYGEWYHLGELTPGEREIRVSLSANNHSELTVGGEPIEDIQTITVPEKSESSDSHDDNGAMEMDMSDVEATGDEKTFELTVADGKITSGGTTLVANQGDMVRITITADEDEEFHVHGYDESVQLTAGEPAELTFMAGASGRFPIELEESKTELGALEVQPQ